MDFSEHTEKPSHKKQLKVGKPSTSNYIPIPDYSQRREQHKKYGPGPFATDIEVQKVSRPRDNESQIVALPFAQKAIPNPFSALALDDASGMRETASLPLAVTEISTPADTLLVIPREVLGKPTLVENYDIAESGTIPKRIEHTENPSPPPAAITESFEQSIADLIREESRLAQTLSFSSTAESHTVEDQVTKTSKAESKNTEAASLTSVPSPAPPTPAVPQAPISAVARMASILGIDLTPFQSQSPPVPRNAHLLSLPSWRRDPFPADPNYVIPLGESKKRELENDFDDNVSKKFKMDEKGAM